MRPVDKSLYTKNETNYVPYGNAKNDLIHAIGSYCSYCERESYSAALDVEHVQDKDTHPDKESDWNNFVLACKNCNSIKGIQQVDFEQIILPHLNDTYHCFEYLEGGLIQVNQQLSVSIQEKATKLVQLVGLDRRPGHSNYSTKDTRWEERKKVWETAHRYFHKYQQQACNIEPIIDLAISYGFWSIWMNVFKPFSEVQQALIESFTGTKKTFFDDVLLP